MSGIYIHIPFCRQRCHYCDFYTTTQVKRKPELIQALVNELIIRKEWLAEKPVKTIYFGGGTPSLLATDDLKLIFDTIYKHYAVVDNPEITLEANPDDLSAKYLANLKTTLVNRLSIGTQSFHEVDLSLMNRRHGAMQAFEAIKESQEAGFDNISVDLIYGLPNSNPEMWAKNLEQVADLNIQHLSAYHLTFEPNTVFDVKKKKGELLPIKEENSIKQFKMLIEWAAKNKLEHYEISNFGKQGYYSKHNTSYWMQQKYLGIGPSAHSYNLESRSWNVANLSKYIDKISGNEKAYEIEILSPNDIQNEFLITGLRTRWGVNLLEFEAQFGSYRKVELLNKAKLYISDKSLYIKENSLILTDEGVFICDAILADLMIVNEE